MPFYLIEQRGVPGRRLVEAEKPQTALNHVIEDAFTVKRVTDRELVDAAKELEIEVAGAPKVEPEPEQEKRVDNPVDPDDTQPIVERDPDDARDDAQDKAMNAYPDGEDEFGKIDG